MRSHQNLTVMMMIRKFGETVPHRKRVKTVIDASAGEYEYNYEDQEPKRGQFNEIMPYDELMTRFGVKSEADYLGTFLPDTDVAEGDLLYVHGYWMEILNLYRHRTSGTIDYLEGLMRKQ